MISPLVITLDITLFHKIIVYFVRLMIFDIFISYNLSYNSVKQLIAFLFQLLIPTAAYDQASVLAQQNG